MYRHETDIFFISASSFAGKTKLFNSLERFKLQRHYDGFRYYEGIYMVAGDVIVDLDVEAFHIFECVDVASLKEIFARAITEVGKSSKPYFTPRAIWLIGHYRSDADFFVLNKTNEQEIWIEKQADPMHTKLRLEVRSRFKDSLERMKQYDRVRKLSWDNNTIPKVLIKEWEHNHNELFKNKKNAILTLSI